MTVLKLTAAPTFDAVVEVPQLGGEPVKARFTFKHRTRDEFRALLNQAPEEDERADEEVVMEVAAGWELADPFTVENVRLLCQHYSGAAPAVIRTYLREFAKARLGN